MDVAHGTVVVFSDIGCPWAHLAVHRLHATRARLGLDDDVRLKHRPFPLEVVNSQPTPKHILDAEIPVVGALEPDAGWQVWTAPTSTWPVSTLPALEAVQAAEMQSLLAAEQLDRALRRALFAEHRCVTMLHEVVAVARTCPDVDAEEVEAALWDGRARHRIAASLEESATQQVQGSPHLFLPDGTDVHNPGIDKHWVHEPGTGFPVVDADDQSVYEDVLRRAAGGSPHPVRDGHDAV